MRDCAWLVVCLGLFLAACESSAPEWTEGEVALIYGTALAALQQEAAHPDTLFVDPRPRFLVHDRPRRFRMGDFNRYGDPALSAALLQDTMVSACRVPPMMGCSRADHKAFATVSEVLPLGAREAVILASHVTLADNQVSSRDLFIQLRFRSGEWYVMRIEEGESVEVARGMGWSEIPLSPRRTWDDSSRLAVPWAMRGPVLLVPPADLMWDDV